VQLSDIANRVPAYWGSEFIKRRVSIAPIFGASRLNLLRLHKINHHTATLGHDATGHGDKIQSLRAYERFFFKDQLKTLRLR